MRTTTTLILLLSAGCVTTTRDNAYDPAELRASTEQAMRYADEQCAADGVERDPAELSDAELIDATRAAADRAVTDGCRVEGVLGGTFTGEVAGDHSGRWFALDQVERGDVAGTWSDDDGFGGPFGGEWEAEDGRYGTLRGAWASGGVDGVYEALYDETEGPAHGTAGGIWYDFETQEGGYYLGVWGDCSERESTSGPFGMPV